MYDGAAVAPFLAASGEGLLIIVVLTNPCKFYNFKNKCIQEKMATLSKPKNHLLSAEIFMKLSFCTTCKGRTFHLKQTLPQNLKVVRQFSEVELIVLNYNSPDDLDEWIRMTFKK